MEMTVASFFETAMIICFGISWPLSILRSYRSRSTKGKSLLFMCFIEIGYICGLINKFMTGSFNLAFIFYWPNLIMVATDICLYFRNKSIERNQDRAASSEN